LENAGLKGLRSLPLVKLQVVLPITISRADYNLFIMIHVQHLEVQIYPDIQPNHLYPWPPNTLLYKQKQAHLDFSLSPLTLLVKHQTNVVLKALQAQLHAVQLVVYVPVSASQH
jgi:hypothetical protein